MTWKSAVWKAFDAIAWLTLIGWICYASMGTNVFGSNKRWPDTMVDYHLIHDFALLIVKDRAYSHEHSYPPPAVVMHYTLTRVPFPVSAAFWLFLTTSSAVACWHLLARMLRLTQRPGAIVLVLLALFLCSYQFIWDLRSQNTNAIFLMSVLLGGYFLANGRPRGAGFWLAFSLAFKLFSVLLIPYLLFSGQRRAFVWAVAFTAGFWLILPASLFGWGGEIDIYASWFRQLALVSNHEFNLSRPIVTSLYNSIHWLTNGDGQATFLIFNAFRGAWLVVGLAGAASCWRRRAAPGDAFGMLADVGLLLLGPIAVSPYLEPYHPTALAIPAILLLVSASDARQKPHVRVLSLLFYLAAVTLTLWPTEWEFRGIMFNLILLTVTGGVTAITWLRRSFPAKASTAYVLAAQLELPLAA